MNIFERIQFETYNLLNWLGIPIELFYFLLGLSLLIYFIFKARKIDKNENIFKIMFSEKYDKDFGGFEIGKIKKRHNFILEFFSVLIATIFAFIRLLLYIIDNY
jgi:hypothetical protein